MEELNEKNITIKTAAQFPDWKPEFLWYPYIPRNEYTVVMGDSGVGKGFFVAGICANITAGNKLPGETEPREPKNVLFISSEDDGSAIKKRMKDAGADLERIYIIDKMDSNNAGLVLETEEGRAAFDSAISRCTPELVIIDPWQAFLGKNVDTNRMNQVRPILQAFSVMAQSHHCGMILISHINKRAQSENVNFAAMGSTEFINASRSAIRVVMGENGGDERIAVHTKSNHAAAGRSQKFFITKDGFEWGGVSSVTKEMLEDAARNRKTLAQVLQDNTNAAVNGEDLFQALIEEAESTNRAAIRISYADFKKKYGEEIFGEPQPSRALKKVEQRLNARCIALTPSIKLNTLQENGKPTSVRGFAMTKLKNFASEAAADDDAPEEIYEQLPF